MVRGGHAALASAHRAVTVLRAPRKGCAGGLMLTRLASCFGLSEAPCRFSEYLVYKTVS